MMKSTKLISAALLLSALVSAQSETVFPPEYDRAWGRGSTSLLGGNLTRTQLVYANAFPIGTVITGISFRPTTSNVDRASFTADMELRCSSTTALPGALDANWTNNIGSDEAIVLPQQTVTIPDMPANRSTGLWADIPFQTPFVFGLNGNTNLCVEIFVYSRSSGASWSTDRAFASANGRAATAGLGCGSATISSTSSGGTYVPGAAVNFTLAGAPASTAAVLVPSLDVKEFVPGLLLPFPLTSIGAGAGCDLLVNPQIGVFPYLVDAAGAASASFTIPASYFQAGLSAQWVYLTAPTPGNQAGLETTANRFTWIGPEVCVPNYQYAWNLSSHTATANVTTNSIPIAKFTTL